jgi:hypothetical protein
MKPINQRGVDLSTDRAISDICGGRHLMDGVVGKHTKRTFMTDGPWDYLRNTQAIGRECWMRENLREVEFLLHLGFNNSNSLLFCSSRPGRPPKRAPVGLSLAASHLQHQQLKKQRLDNGDYPYENGHMGGKYSSITASHYHNSNMRPSTDSLLNVCTYSTPNTNKARGFQNNF